jgi:eukaryotic-like serine/threonine-protein kinase
VALLDTRLPAELAGRYRFERELGRGGMATVFLAHDLRHGRVVAVKVLHPELAGAVGPDRFLREIRIAAGLEHPNILPLYDSGSCAPPGGTPALYYVMPFVEGESLRSRLMRERQLPVGDALRIAGDVAAALASAHHQGIIHRDIKPENILLSGYPPPPGSTGGWRVFLADFGIAKAVDDAGAEELTETGLALGTPAYMSPEQAGAERHLDQRSDLYALGCVLYEMLAGQPPFTGVTARAILARHALDPVPSLRSVRPNVPESLERAVTRLLAKVPADRFATADELAHALGDGRVVPWPSRSRSQHRRLMLAAGIAAAAAAVALGVLRWRRPMVPISSPGVVAVLPFRVAGADPSLQYLREGIVDLLALKLTGEGGPRAADPRAVLSAWRRAGGSASDDVAPDAAVGIAQRLGAGRLIDGGVVGTPDHLTLTASVLQVPGGRHSAPVSVEGPPDSVAALVDRLTAELLAGEAGRTELASLTSLPVLRAYFEGQRAYRLGRWVDALRAFSKAIALDSAFGQPAMGLYSASLWLSGGPPGTDVGRAIRLAWADRARLSPRERALLVAWFGPRYPGAYSEAELLAARQQGVAAAPDSPEMWYELGDEYFHFGPIIGVDSSLSRAAYAFRRSLALDSASAVFPTFAEPLVHLVQIAGADGDSATARRLVTTALAADSTTDQAGFLRWAQAAASRDTTALRSVRDGFPRMSGSSLVSITNASQEMGMGWKDAQLAIAAMRTGDPTPAATRGAFILTHVLALNRGRPKEALAALQARPEHWTRERLERRVADALYWDGDTAAGAAGARELHRFAAAPRAERADDREAQDRDLCLEQQWRLARGDSATTRAAIGRLRSADAPGGSISDSVPPAAAPRALCAAVLEAWLATLGRRADAGLLLDRLDSLVTTGAGGSVGLQDNLILARLREAAGDPRGALAAVRRRVYGLQPEFLSTHLREEGRLAALTGDTAEAISAYRQYLALRSDPEPALKPGVERVREELAGLLGEPR